MSENKLNEIEQFCILKYELGKNGNVELLNCTDFISGNAFILKMKMLYLDELYKVIRDFNQLINDNCKSFALNNQLIIDNNHRKYDLIFDNYEFLNAYNKVNNEIKIEKSEGIFPHYTIKVIENYL